MHPKLAQLRDFIAGRPIAILGQGNSIENLKDHLQDFPANTLWASQTFFWAVEPIIEHGLNRRFDLVYQSSPQLIQAAEPRDKFVKFLARPDNNLLLTSTGAVGLWNEHSPQLLERYKHKVVIAQIEPGAPEMPEAFRVSRMPGLFFSFIFCLLMLLKAEARLILLFGFDGGNRGGAQERWYYGRPEDYWNWWGVHHEYGSELASTNGYWKELLRHSEIEEQLVKIINVTPGSQLECFPKVGYSEIKDVLKAEGFES